MARTSPGWVLALAVVISLGGCRTTGQATSESWDWGSATFTPNPASVGPFYGGAGVGFVATLPLCLISWPLTSLLYPDEEDEFFLSASLAPSFLAGTALGSLLGAIFYPFGTPFLPPDAAPGPDR